MNPLRIRTSALICSVDSPEPPREFKLWNAGENPTDYGVHRWTERSVREVFEQYSARGNPLLIDIEHGGAVDEDGKPLDLAGYAALELRNGEPWLVFDWSAVGDQQIRTKQRRFLSPDYYVDKATGEIVSLKMVSLVGSPGTHHARILASATENKKMDFKLFLAALRAALASEDPATCKESVQSLVNELDSTVGAAPESSPEGAGVETAADDDPTQEQPEQASAPPAGEQEAQASAPPPGEKEGVSASAPRAAKQVAPRAAKPAAAVVEGAAKEAVEQIRASQRDHLIQMQGDRLDPSIRRWAATQPLDVVKGLLDAAPAKGAEAARVTATRGARQGLPATPPGLTGEALEEVRASMGRGPASPPKIINTEHELVLPLMRPSAIREHIAASAAGKDSSK